MRRDHRKSYGYTLDTAAVLLQGKPEPATRGAMFDGTFRRYSVCQAKTPHGVRFNRLIRLYKRLFINREQGGRVNG